MIRLSRIARVMTASAIGLSILGTSGCGLIAGEANDEDLLTVCTTLPYEPFQYKDDNNEIVGFDVDMIDLVAEELGKEQQINDTGFDPIKSGEAVNGNQCQIAAAAITITPEREEVMDFSDPYYDSYQSLAVVPDSDVDELGDMDDMVLGAQGETTGAEYANEHSEEHGYTVKTFRNLGELREALLNDQIDGAINDVPVWNAQVTNDPDSIEIVDEYDTGEQYGYAMAKDDEETMNAVNKVIADAKEDGTYAELYEKWIGEEYEEDE